MNIKSLLLGSAAALVAVSGARAADAVVVAEPEPVEYVRVCDVYGTSFYYIPGTEICLKVGGYVQYDIGAGDLFGAVSDTGDDTWYKRGRFQLRIDARSETELGTLRGYFAYNFNWTTGRSGALVFVDGDGDGIVEPDELAFGTTSTLATAAASAMPTSSSAASASASPTRTSRPPPVTRRQRRQRRPDRLRPVHHPPDRLHLRRRQRLHHRWRG